jgi:hypothetical protein
MDCALLPTRRPNRNARIGGKPMRANAHYAGGREQEFRHGRDKRAGGRKPPPRV